MTTNAITGVIPIAVTGGLAFGMLNLMDDTAKKSGRKKLRSVV